MKNAEMGYGERLRQRASAQLRLPLGFHFLSALILVSNYLRVFSLPFSSDKVLLRRVLVSASESEPTCNKTSTRPTLTTVTLVKQKGAIF